MARLRRGCELPALYSVCEKESSFSPGRERRTSIGGSHVSHRVRETEGTSTQGGREKKNSHVFSKRPEQRPLERIEYLSPLPRHARWQGRIRLSWRKGGRRWISSGRVSLRHPPLFGDSSSILVCLTWEAGDALRQRTPAFLLLDPSQHGFETRKRSRSWLCFIVRSVIIS